MKAPSSWTSRVEAYITYRRSLGYALTADASQLLNFARFADRIGENTLTVSVAIRWVTSSEQQSTITWARRLNVVRCFAKYYQQLDAATEIPPRGFFGIATRRLTPHVFTEAELVALLDASKCLRPRNGLRPATCFAVFGLLAATGLRISEALNLTREDVDLDAGLLNVREAKFHKQRFVPMHQSVVVELRRYARMRDRIVRNPQSAVFFLMDNGKPANLDGINQALRTICNRLGWHPRGDYQRHRLHDFRHSFIVRNLLHFSENMIDPEHSVHLVSTYVGHTSISSTYWYITGVPDLLALAARNLERGGQQ